MSINLQETFRPDRAWRYANPRTATDYLPLVYGDMKGGNKGIWDCPCIDTVNFYYLISDSTILSAANGNSFTVYDKDSNVIDPAEYAIADNHVDENGKHVAIIDFTANQEAKEPISIKCKGKNNGSVLIENPIEIIEDFIVNIAGGISSDFNAFAFQKAKTVCSGYKAAGLIDGDRSIGTTLSEILFSFQGEWWKNHLEKIIVMMNTTNQVFDWKGEIFEKSIKGILASQDEKNLCNQAEVNYCYNYRLDKYEEGDNGETIKDQLSQNIHGEKIKTFELKWCRDLPTVNTIQSIIVDRFKNAVWMVQFDNITLQNIHFEKGDFILFNYSGLYDTTQTPFQNRIVQVLVKVINLNDRVISFEVIDKGVSYHPLEETPEEIINISEIISKDFGKNVSESLNISEFVAKQVVKLVSDGASISEIIAKEVGKMVAESVSISEQAWKNAFEYDGAYNHDGPFLYGNNYGVLI